MSPSYVKVVELVVSFDCTVEILTTSGLVVVRSTKSRSKSTLNYTDFTLLPEVVLAVDSMVVKGVKLTLLSVELFSVELLVEVVALVDVSLAYKSGMFLVTCNRKDIHFSKSNAQII